MGTDPVPEDHLLDYDIRTARFPDDAYYRFLVEQKAKKLGVSWADYCAERDRIKLASGGFSQEVWQGCTLRDRINMMAQLKEMSDDQFCIQLAERSARANERRGTW